MGRAACDVERRTLASAGLLTEATPVSLSQPTPSLAVASSRRCDAAARGSARRRQPPVPPARRILWLDHHPPVRRLMTLARVRNPEALRYQAPGEWGAIGPRPLPRGQDAAPQDPVARQRRAHRARLASGTGSQLGHRARRRLGHAGRGRPRESVRWAQRSAAETLRRAPEAVFAGLRELLGQRPRRSAPAVPAPLARSWSRRSSTTWCPTW